VVTVNVDAGFKLFAFISVEFSFVPSILVRLPESS